ncbi:MAG: hypothetical protein ACYCT1_08070 [Steroidobacteraceae bacterium]
MKQFDLAFTPYTRRDPVSGTRQTLLRTKHSHQSSPVLIEHHRCVRASMEGVRARSADPRENSIAIRSALAQASRSCGGRGGRRSAERRERVPA